MEYWTSYGVGQYAAGEAHVMYLPYGYRRDATKRVIVWCHGAGGTYAVGPQEQALAAAGFPMIACDLAPAQSWGSDASLSRVTDAWTFAKANMGVKTDKMLLWGGSMGTLTALLYALAHPADVAAVGCALPIVDPDDVRVNNRGGYQANIEAIYGAGVTVPDNKRPSQNAGSYSMPMRFWRSTSDIVGLPALADTFDTAVATCDTISLGAVGHAYEAQLAAGEPAAFFSPYLS